MHIVDVHEMNRKKDKAKVETGKVREMTRVNYNDIYRT